MANNTEFLFKIALEQEQVTPDKAAEIYRQLLLGAPEHAAAHINLGTILYNQQHFEEAGEQYRQAIMADPKYALAYFNLGNTEDELGHSGEAIKCYKKALAVAPAYKDAHYNLALALQKTEPCEALKHWQCYMKLDPSGPWHDYAAKMSKLIAAATGLQLVRSNPAPARTPERGQLKLMQRTISGPLFDAHFYRPEKRPTPGGDDGPEAA